MVTCKTPSLFVLTVWVFVLGAGGNLLVESAFAVQHSEDFNTEPADWVGFNNREGLNDFGWSNTSFVNEDPETPGEAGGFFARDASTPDFGWYAKPIPDLDLSNTGFTFSGNWMFKNPQFDYFNIGYFNADDGVNVGEGPGDPGFANTFFGIYTDDRFVFAPRWNHEGISPGSPPNMGQFPANVKMAFTMTYDPNGNGGTGSVTGDFNGTPFNANLPAGLKDEFNVFTHFGLVTRNSHRGTIFERQTPTFVDDLIFTIPDPVTAVVGDYNEDGAVDAADYVVWRDNEGTTNTLPNRDPSSTGTIGALDYQIWAANFGKPSPGGGALNVSATVPEPSTAVMAMIWISIGLISRRSSRVTR